MDTYLGIFISHPPETLAIILNILLETGTIYFWRRIPWRYRLLCIVVGLAGIYIGISEIVHLEGIAVH
ncbi:MAG: hypothetical protein ACM3MF_09380 [Anaerolineae bacterium]